MSQSPLEILHRLSEAPTYDLLRRHVSMGRCCILDAAIDSAQRESVCELVGKITQILGNDPVLAQLRARVGLIQAFVTDGDLMPAVKSLVEVTEEAWSYKRTPEMHAVGKQFKPSFMQLLEAGADGLDKGSKPGNVSRLADLLAEVADDQAIGWMHPGLQLAGEMLAALVGDTRPFESSVETTVMFAVSNAADPRGILARLHVERVPHGCGLLLPDAFHGGYLRMHAASFSTGLQNALHAARGFVKEQGWDSGKGINYDWRWRLDLLHARSNLPKALQRLMQLPIHGRSAEVAFACAMIATAQGNPDENLGTYRLDPHIGATASLDTTSENWPAGSFIELPLADVEAIKDKTLLDDRAKQERLAAVVVAQEQPAGSLPLGDQYEFLPAMSLQAAYQSMTRFPRMTRRFNQAAMQLARGELRKNCRPYVRSWIGIEPHVSQMTTASNSETAISTIEQPIALEKTEMFKLITGRLRPRYKADAKRVAATPVASSADDSSPAISRLGNRVWVNAESGYGKSVFILSCQYSIAKFGGGCVPIRLGRTRAMEDFELSDVAWPAMLTRETTAEVLLGRGEVSEIARLAFPENDSHTITDKDKSDWFQWLLRNGQIVFLLDALDQSDGPMQSLGSFLQHDNIQNCPVILTGRPESKINQSKAFRGPLLDWDELRLLPFDATRQRRYLGPDLSEKLVPNDDFVFWKNSTDAEELRRQDWRELLQSPLLLSMVKQLADEAGTQWFYNFRSKFALYDAAVEHLITQARGKIENQDLQESLQDDERKWLAEIAWFMVQNHQWGNSLRGPRLNELKKRFRDKGHPKLFDAITRINLATLSQVVEHSSSGNVLAFRHRSFLEFFAGHYLVSQIEESRLDETLAQIHQMTDQADEILSHLLPNVDRPLEWQETLRFALAAADTAVRHRLALKLLELGNPWVLFHSAHRDHVEYDPDLRYVVSWLVRQDYNWKFDYRIARSPDDSLDLDRHHKRAFKKLKLNASHMLSHSTRDAAWLAPLRRLIGDQPFRKAYYQTASHRSGLLDRIKTLGSRAGISSVWNFLDSMVRVPGGHFDPRQYHDDIELSPFEIKEFHLADFPVTNALFELFCPSHRRWRDDISQQPSDPVIYVNWYMANEFCIWLSDLTGHNFRLPTEWEWEWACRWLGGPENSRCHDAFWWGPKMEDRICWYGAYTWDPQTENWTKSNGPAATAIGTRSRFEAIAAHETCGLWHPSGGSLQQPGLIDMAGNVWEWCADLAPNGSSRVLRGGSWSDLADHCRSSFRSRSPDVRNYDYGFRVCRV